MADTARCLGSCARNRGGTNEEGREDRRRNQAGDHQAVDPQLGLLLHCDKDGADSVVVDKVRAYGGYVYTVRYDQWLDDGFGGPARAVKTPKQSYTQQDCQRVFQKWMDFLN